MNDICGMPLKSELEQINKYTRRELKENEVYVFPVVLCDNEIDRDGERFSDQALEKLAELFVGVTGIADHDPKSLNQTARIFSCKVETVEGKLTSDGRMYKRLYAKAYVPKSEQSIELILALDSGIKKEVSVGCSVGKRICSVCGQDISVCEHIKGRKYNGQKCFVTLDEPSDAYEWSFVAVPAQKAAGVVKCLSNKAEIKNTFKGADNMDIEKKLFSNTEQSFSAEELQELAKRLESLREKALDGDYYRSVLVKNVNALASLVIPKLGRDTLDKITKALSVKQLDEFRNSLEAKAADKMPMKPQLFRENNRAANNNTLYKNI